MKKKQVILVARDLVFTTKVRATAQALGLECTVARTEEAFLRALEADRSSRIVIDLNLADPDPFRLIAEAGAQANIAAFFSHVDVELRERALALGVREVLPRSHFASHLAEVLSAG